jgi:hypothetical protein
MHAAAVRVHACMHAMPCYSLQLAAYYTHVLMICTYTDMVVPYVYGTKAYVHRIKLDMMIDRDNGSGRMQRIGSAYGTN